MENNDDIDNIFKNAFENMEFKPNHNDWLSMKDKMQKEGITSKSSNTKKVILLWSIISLFMAGVGLYFILPSQQNKTNKALLPSPEKTEIITELQKTDQIEPSIHATQVFEKNKLQQHKATSLNENKVAATKNLTAHSKVDFQNSFSDNAPFNDSNNKEENNAIVTSSPSISDHKVNDITLIAENQEASNSTQTIKEQQEKNSALELPKDKDKKRPIPCPSALNNTKKHLFYSGPYCSVDKSFSTMINNINNVGDRDLADSKELEGENNFQYTAGIIMGVSVSSRISIETGIFYAQKVKINTTAMGISGTHTYTFNYNGRYIDVPLRAKIYLNKKFLRWYIMPGMVANINTPDNGYFKDEVYNDATYVISLMPQSVGMSAQIGTGLEGAITDRFSWYIEPSAKFALSPLVKHKTYELPINHFINTISIGGGVIYKF